MLFEPYKIKNTLLRNRIAMAPMTRNQSPEGIPTNEVVSYYKRRAEADVGLIITEGVEVSHKASSAYPDVPRLDSEKARDGWKRVVGGIKEHDGAVIAQLWHCGGFRKLGMGPNPEVPGHTASGLVRPGKRVAHAMSSEDIKETIDAFASDAKYCEEIGFDGVEIHGAHGYLIDNFFWRGTNEREDLYGGSIEKRSQLAANIVKAIRSNVSNNFIVGLRFSQWKQQDYEAKLAASSEELLKVIKQPVDAGLDYLHSSMRRFWESEFEGSDENLAFWTKKLTGLPTISVGSVGLDSDFIDMSAPASPRNIDKAISDISNKKYDMVAVGRALLADYEWVIKMREGRIKDIIPYTKEALYKLY
ncbi:MAG: NADH:flavin oxidoreductase [Gammaproteobacteria bacterium]|jgi:2,4-dienoyl-CoA reductase-like NADH-dependent reductase (Old Yellow Enzyme family)|uniref:12-oxophytodienoate reductase n=1 Tax=SAR86 cluster bacterium TaxID=2030880 RepID=A0A368C835_9GAMM|nr:MAG: 12-oxophytodienoate reductase [SAR86 cluster bacterium]|tara:strand:+ start:87 stop:1166 length:1080 start_codon:yes stop_codon:yes gene_type:complete